MMKSTCRWVYPAGFILAPAMEQVQDRVAPRDVRPIARWCVDEAAAPLVSDRRKIPLFAHVTVRHILGVIIAPVRVKAQEFRFRCSAARSGTPMAHSTGLFG
jgi:hypothetical protein